MDNKIVIGSDNGTAAFIPSIGQISTAILNENGSHWFDGLALTLIER